MGQLDKCNVFLWESTTVNNCNSYFFDSEKKILIDPGHLEHFEHVENGLNGLGYGIEDIDVVLCTHVHPDHVEAQQRFTCTKSLFGIHMEEWGLMRSMKAHISSIMKAQIEDFQPDFFVTNGVLSIGDMEFHIIHSPGHSPGSVCIYWPAEKLLISGDVIFAQGLGRTDLPGGNGQALKQSIINLAKLEIEFLLPGHGPLMQDQENIKNNFKYLQDTYFNYI